MQKKITVTATGGIPPLIYSLNGISFQPGNVFSNLVAGNYIVTVKDATGDTASVNVSIASINNLQISMVTTGQTCSGINGAIIVSFTGGVQPVQFQLNNGPFVTNNNFGSLLSGTYNIHVKDGYGCLASQTVFIPLADTLNIDAGPDKTICEGKSTMLFASSNGTNFNWIPAGSLLNISSLNPTASPTVTTKYFIKATLGICNNVDSTIVFVHPAPVANAGTDVTTCIGQNIQLNGAGGQKYQWAPPTNLSDTLVSNPYVINPQTPISYFLIVVDDNGCASLKKDTVNVLVTPAIPMFAGRDTFVVRGQPIQLNAYGLGGSQVTSFVWSPAHGLNNPLVQNPVATLTQDITYTVTGYNSSGCAGADQVKIDIIRNVDIYIPDAFTPNWDGKNDILKALPRGIRQFHYFTVFNRWGEKLFTTKDPQYGWDGTFNGKELASGVFVWMTAGVDYDGKLIERKGTVILIR